MSSKISKIKTKILPEKYSEHDLSFKIIVIGDSGVGKSSLTIKATKNYFEEFYSPTVGFEFFTFNTKIIDDKKEQSIIKLQIWDTCGQEAYRSLINSFYRNSSLAIIVYSVNDQNSFNNLDAWINEVKAQSNPNIKLFLIGNKIDKERKIPKELAEEFCKENGVDYFVETSARTGFNAQNVFVEAAKILYEENNVVRERISKEDFFDFSLYSRDSDYFKNQILELDVNKNLKKEDNKKLKKCCE